MLGALMVLRRVAHIVQWIGCAVLGSTLLWESALHARNNIYSGDELINADAALSWLRFGDYTSSEFGGIPFDPAISTGILGTWIHGSALLAGGSLYDARLANVVAQFSVVLLLGLYGLRRHVAQPGVGLLLFLPWAALHFLPNAQQAMSSPGELWGAIVLAAGCAVWSARPVLAVVLWASASWLCKEIYLPFSLALLAADLWVHAGRRGWLHARRVLVGRALAFLAPLLAWMAGIAISFDLATAGRWCVSKVVFLAAHGASFDLNGLGLPTLEGWRFHPGWQNEAFVAQASDVVAPVVVATLAGPLATLITWRYTRDRAFPLVVATSAAIVAYGAWFHWLDATQWDRHLLPANFVSIGLLAYCLGATAIRARTRALAFILFVWLGVFLVVAGIRGRVAVEAHGWRASYASACTLERLQGPECRPREARTLLAPVIDLDFGSAAPGVCEGAERGAFEHCVRGVVVDFLEGRLATRPDGDTVVEIGYGILVLQSRLYTDPESFREDFRVLICRPDRQALRNYLQRARIGVECGRVAGA